MRGTRKRKLKLDDIAKCNPHISMKRRKYCLPSKVYSSVAKTLKLSKATPNWVLSQVGCNNNGEHCFLDKAPLNDDVKKQLRKDYLRPRYPKAWLNDPDTWLDNFNIQDTMKQYETAYRWFKFLGVFPIDFSAPDPYTKSGAKCLNNELCTLKLKEEYTKGVRGIGVVFNLDPHFKGGSHWVALYIDLSNPKKFGSYYFDSYGYKTPALIARLMRSFRLQTPNIDLGYNARRFQYSNTECGMFSMYFLICMIQGIKFKDFCKDTVNDKFMLELRKRLFRL